MSSCCSKNIPETIQKCPQCTDSSRKTSMKTIFHQVQFPDILNISIDNYYFCINNSCSVAYFSQSSNIIYKEQLRSASELLCYCFDISKQNYLNAIKDNSATAIKKFVIQKTKMGDCACEVRNPSGHCCLADFKQLEHSFNNTMDIKT